jgi:hypothetical protein
MKKYLYFLLFIAVLVPSCKKTDDSGSDKWTAEDEQFYNNVLALQDQASESFETWILSMDTATALNQVQQLFIHNASVSSATLGSQGIAVEYTNGMCGGIFLNPKDVPHGGLMKPNDFPKIPPPVKTLQSRVNIKKAIFINPSYWERSVYADWIIQWYNVYLPKVFYTLQDVYKNQDASVERFTELAGHGFIHIYSHGFAWPEENNIRDVYLMTGEVANLTSTLNYWNDILSRTIIITTTKNSSGWKNIYLINKDFIAGHNDFKKDTIVFYGGFCYSFRGTWSQLTTKFAKGSYAGFTWSVQTDKNAAWAVSMINWLCDTTAKPPYTCGNWYMGADPPKSYYDSTDKKIVSTVFLDNGATTFWEPPVANFSWTSGSKQNPTEICDGSSVTVKDKSLDHGQPITDWQWYFQNGQPKSYNGQQPPAIYFNSVGSGGIKLTITNPFGKSTKEVSFSVVTCK